MPAAWQHQLTGGDVDVNFGDHVVVGGTEEAPRRLFLHDALVSEHLHAAHRQRHGYKHAPHFKLRLV